MLRLSLYLRLMYNILWFSFLFCVVIFNRFLYFVMKKPYVTCLKKVCLTIKKLKLTLAEKALLVSAALTCPGIPPAHSTRLFTTFRQRLNYHCYSVKSSVCGIMHSMPLFCGIATLKQTYRAEFISLIRNILFLYQRDLT